MTRHLYSELMNSEDSISIVVNLDLSQPIEISDFVSSFAGLGGQFERFLKDKHPELQGEVKVYIKEVRKGSLIAELIPLAYNAIITTADHSVIASTFVKEISRKIDYFRSAGGRLPDASKTELTEIVDIVSGVANDPDGKATISALKYKKGKSTTEFEMEMTTREAKQMVQEIDAQFIEMEQKADFDYENELLIFYQSNRKDTDKSGEKGIIENISTKPLAVVYASDLAKEHIKSEMLSGDRNIYKLGFFVDVNVPTQNGEPVAYKIKAVNDVIDLPDDDD